MPIAFAIDRASIADFCRSHYIRRLSLFGSVTRPDFQGRSDIDLLVEFQQGHVPGLEFFTMQDELSRMIGRSVDLNTPHFLSPAFRDEVMAGAEAIYAEE